MRRITLVLLSAFAMLTSQVNPNAESHSDSNRNSFTESIGSVACLCRWR